MISVKITKLSAGGFTLVEVLAAVGVLAVGSLAFLPAFTNANKERNLQQSVENARDALANARNRALTGVNNPGAGNIYRYSGVKFTAGNANYELFRSVNADTPTCINPNANGVSDGVKGFASGVVSRIPPAESPTCVFFEFSSGNAYITKGVPGSPAVADACQN
ncbi:MAG: type II secretion system protein [bacterium]